MEPDALTSIFRSESEVRLNLVQAQLQDAGITAMYRSWLVSCMDGAIRGPGGEIGEVIVRAEDAERANQILQDLGASLGWEGYEQAESDTPDSQPPAPNP